MTLKLIESVRISHAPESLLHSDNQFRENYIPKGNFFFSPKTQKKTFSNCCFQNSKHGKQILNIIDNWGDSDDEDDDLDEILGDGDDEEDRESGTDGPPLVGDHTALQPQQVNNDFEAEIVDTDDMY